MTAQTTDRLGRQAFAALCAFGVWYGVFQELRFFGLVVI